MLLGIALVFGSGTTVLVAQARGARDPAAVRASVLLRVTVLGTAVQLGLADALTGFGLPGVCLAMVLAAAVQCAAAGLLFRRDPAQEETGVSSVRTG